MRLNPSPGSLVTLLLSGLFYTVEGQAAPRLLSGQGDYSILEVTSIFAILLPILSPVFARLWSSLYEMAREVFEER